MRLLITGASGFIGRNALIAIPPSWEVIALYRPPNTAFLTFLETHHLTNVFAVACDLTIQAEVTHAMQRAGAHFDSGLYLASNTSIPASIEQPIADLTTNTIGLLHVLNACTCDHLIYFSSGAVYIGLTGLVSPAMAISPTLPYAISKLSAEHYIRAYVLHHQNPKHATIVRFFGAYGPYEPPRKLYTKLVRRFAFERTPTFTVTGDGKNYIDAMYIEDAMRAILVLLTTPPPTDVRCIDLGVGSRESVNTVVMRAAHAFGLEADITYAGTSPEYIRFFIDPQQFAAVYGFQPTIHLEDGLHRLATHLEAAEP